MTPHQRLFFVCYPDTNATIGGVKQIYRQVELLHRAGWQAWVVQEQPGFRPDWFESSAPVIHLEGLRALPPDPSRDLIVLPETWLRNLPAYLSPVLKVIFNQNAFYTFGLDGNCHADTLALYGHPDLKAVVTVSDDSRELLVRGCGVPADRCFTVTNGIDPQLFFPPAVKTRRIVFPARKHADHARKVALMAQTRPHLSRYPFRELPRMPHAQLAQELRDALLFISIGHPEGFGLPLAEALASGCLVVGYHGLGGRDFALPSMQAVEFGDLLGMLDAIETELRRFEDHPEQVAQERMAIAQAIQQRYGPQAEHDQAVKVWTDVIRLAFPS